MFFLIRLKEGIEKLKHSSLETIEITCLMPGAGQAAVAPAGRVNRLLGQPGRAGGGHHARDHSGSVAVVVVALWTLDVIRNIIEDVKVLWIMM